MSRRRRTYPRTNADGERGAVLVEAAFIFPVLLLILFGIIEFGLAFRDSLGVAAATRAGARTASAQPRNTDYAKNTASAVARAASALPNGSIEELWVYKAKADGYPVGGDKSFTSCSTCVKFTWDQSQGADGDFRAGGDTWPAASQLACAGSPDTIGVYLRVNHEFVSGYFPRDMKLTDHTVMNLEPMAPSQGCRP